MKNFTYNITTKIFFGENTIENLGPEISKYSKKILIVYGSERIKKNGLFNAVVQQLTKHDITFEEIGGIKPNPTLKSVHQGIAIMKEHNLDFVLAVGGGSVIDASKAIAAGAAMNIDPWLFCKREKGGDLVLQTQIVYRYYRCYRNDKILL